MMFPADIILSASLSKTEFLVFEPGYYEGKHRNKPYGLELILQIHLVQNLYNLSDEGTRSDIIDGRAFSDFCGVESSNQIPQSAHQQPHS